VLLFIALLGVTISINLFGLEALVDGSCIDGLEIRSIRNGAVTPTE